MIKNHHPVSSFITNHVPFPSLSSVTSKISLAAGSLAVITFPHSAHASIVHVSGSPVSTTFGTSSFDFWDVDGDLIAEFGLQQNGSLYLNLWGYVPGASILAVDINSLPNLPGGYSIGPGSPFRPLVTFLTSLGSFDGANGFVDNLPGFFGFQFEQAGQIRYGWAEITFDLGIGTTISQWAYDDSGAAIAVGDTGADVAATPEGDQSAGILLFGLGASGIRAWRKRKQRQLTRDASHAA